MVQTENAALRQKLDHSRVQEQGSVSGSSLGVGKERTLLEAHIRLLLEKVQVSPDQGSREQLALDYITQDDSSISATSTPPSSRSHSRPGTATAGNKVLQVCRSGQLHVDRIDDVLASIREAFKDEEEGLMLEIEELTELLESEAAIKLKAEQQVKTQRQVDTSDLRHLGQVLERQMVAEDHRHLLESRRKPLVPEMIPKRHRAPFPPLQPQPKEPRTLPPTHNALEGRKSAIRLRDAVQSARDEEFLN
ncbi:unnamed protein product [Chrysoparadoxa australica]